MLFSSPIPPSEVRQGIILSLTNYLTTTIRKKNSINRSYLPNIVFAQGNMLNSSPLLSALMLTTLSSLKDEEIKEG